MLGALGYDVSNYNQHSLRGGGTTTADQAGIHFIVLKHEGTWTSDACWQYSVPAAWWPAAASSASSCRIAAHYINWRSITRAMPIDGFIL